MSKRIDPDELVSTAQVAKDLGYHPNYLNRLAASGEIRAWRIGKSWATTRKLVEAYIKSSPKRPAKKRGGRSKAKNT